MADGKMVWEYLGTWMQVAAVLSGRELLAVIHDSELCLIDCLTVTSDDPGTQRVGTGNMKLMPVSGQDA
jgi:hypothetical protein